MKRVTDRSDLASKQVPQYVSGCRQFEGEDLGKYHQSNSHSFISLPPQKAAEPGSSKGLDQPTKERASVGR